MTISITEKRKRKRRKVSRKTYSLVNSTIKHQLHGHSGGNTHSLSHGGVATGDTELAKRTGTGLLVAVLVLDAELVLQHDHVALVWLVLHLALEGGAQGVKRVAARGDLLVGREEADPAEAAEDAVAVFVVGEGGLGRDSPHQVLLIGGRGAQDLPGGFLPGDRRGEEVARLVGQEANVNQGLDHLRETLVAQGATDDGLGLGDLVALTEGGRVTVRVAHESEARVDVVGLSSGHEVGTSNTVLLAIQVELGRVTEGQQDTAAGPRELVTQRVVGVLGGGETTTVREEGVDLAAFSVDFRYSLDSVQVVDTLYPPRVKSVERTLESRDTRQIIPGPIQSRS